MNGFLLDTNVLSEFSRTGEPDYHVDAWLASLTPQAIHISVLTIAEIRRGIELKPAGRRREQLETWLERDFRAAFIPANILSVTEAIAIRWAVWSARAQERGIQVAVIDGLIGATAMEHGLTLATRNVKDFVGSPVTIFNPWEQE